MRSFRLLNDAIRLIFITHYEFFLTNLFIVKDTDTLHVRKIPLSFFELRSIKSVELTNR